MVAVRWRVEWVAAEAIQAEVDYRTEAGEESIREATAGRPLAIKFPIWFAGP